VLPGVTVNANTVTFSITDGGAGDDNLAPDGQIVDQGGPGVPTAVPALGAGMLVLLACVLLVAGASCARRRQKAGRI
jgi:hypothetical protein